jgi:hypothetical protein
MADETGATSRHTAFTAKRSKIKNSFTQAEKIMNSYRQTVRSALAATAAVVLVAGCSMMPDSPNLVAFTTQLRGANEVPPAASNANGQVDAVLNKDTNLLRWRLSYAGLSGPATAGHFHGPAMVGANAGVAVPFAGPVSSPMSGQATLTAAQAADLMAGKWYANIHTAKFPGGEIRGQMTVRP